MDTVKIQQVLAKGRKNGGPFANLWLKAGSASLRLRGLLGKLIGPYLILTLIMAAGGIFIATYLLLDTLRWRFYNSVMEASRVTNNGIVGYERMQLEQLRLLVFTNDMNLAVNDKRPEDIIYLLRPAMAKSQVNLITAIDTNGNEIVTVDKQPGENQYTRQQGRDFLGVSIVNKTLEGKTDAQGDKFAELYSSPDGQSILFTSAPVRDANQKLVGVLMVGTYLDNILPDLMKQSLADHIILIDDQGKLIATNLRQDAEGFDTLVNIAAALGQETDTVLKDVDIDRQPYTVSYSPLVIRGEPIGRVGVIKNRNYVVSNANLSRNLYIALFAVCLLGVIASSFRLYQNISNPILRLRDISKAVASGDLKQHIGLQRSDEIGELGQSFDTMTVQLDEKTQEAARYLAETLQRNKELKEMNERLQATQLQLIQSEKLASIGQLTAGIVHDVKNPFAVIMGMAEVLADDENIDEATRHGLKVIRESAVKGNTIVSDLLKFARQTKPEMRTMDLRETVQTSIRLTAYLTRRYNTTADLPQTSLMLTYDAQQVEQVLINMIHNAVQAMPNGGALRIGLKKVAETGQISIQDTGCGISPEHLKRIFDPFFTTKPEGEGTGLGLSVSYGIITNHQGKINVESELGKGTTFTIILPITQASAATSAEPTLDMGDLHT